MKDLTHEELEQLVDAMLVFYSKIFLIADMESKKILEIKETYSESMRFQLEKGITQTSVIIEVKRAL